MLFQAISAIVFVTLAAVLLPSKRVRQRMLSLMCLTAHGAVISAIAASALFFFRPDWTPSAVAEMTLPVTETLAARAGVEQPGAAWVVIALGLTIVSLPALTLFDFSRRLNGLEMTLAKRTSRKREQPAEEKRPAKTAKNEPSANGKTNAKPARQPAAAPRRTVLECLR